MTIQADRRQGTQRRAHRRGRGAAAVSQRADRAPRTARRRDSRAEASRRHRHLHHRPQRQLHERLRGEVQLLRVLSPGRIAGRLRARLRRDSSGRSTRRSPSAASSCCCRADTIPICRSRGTRICSARSRSAIPSFKLHALSPPEVIHLSRLSQLPVPEVLERLIAAGLDSIPGGGAEILVDRVRKLLHCYGKATADEWLDVMRHAHRPACARRRR